LFIRFHKSFEPTFYSQRLSDPYFLCKPTKWTVRKKWIKQAFPDNWLIFCYSVSDLFAEWTKPEWREKVLDAIRENSQHIFQLLTKQPQNIDINYKFPDNAWVGVTVTSKSEIKNIDHLRRLNAKVKFVSFEPLLEWVNPDLSGIDWIIIGKLTGSRKVRLDPLWVKHILIEARKKHVPVFIKGNLGWPEIIREYPKIKE
jgi:protein gp37